MSNSTVQCDLDLMPQPNKTMSNDFDEVLIDCHHIVDMFLEHRLIEAVAALDAGSKAGSFMHACGLTFIRAITSALDLDKDKITLALKGAKDALKLIKSMRKKTPLLFNLDANLYTDGKC